MKKRKPSQTRRHRESVREKRRARAFYFERQAAKDAESKGYLQRESNRRRKALVDVCKCMLASIIVGCAAAWLTNCIVTLVRR